jgi:hypothetical protein
MPRKSVLNHFFGPIEELNKIYTYDRYANGDVLH